MWFSKSVSDTTERSFVNTRRWSFTHIPSEPPIEGKAQKVNCTLDTIILFCKKCLINWSDKKTRKLKKMKIFLTSLSETSEVCLLFHPPTNNCPSHLRLLCQSCLGHKAFKSSNILLFGSNSLTGYHFCVMQSHCLEIFGPKYC